MNVALSLPCPQSLDQVIVHWGAGGREKWMQMQEGWDREGLDWIRIWVLNEYDSQMQGYG